MRYSALFFAVLLLLVSGMECSYWHRRSAIIERERQIAVGGDVRLTEKEHEVNKLLLKAKHDELAIGKQNASAFLATRRFVDVKNEIEDSKVFRMIKQLPKGCSLHTHLFAAASFEYVFNLTYREGVYVCNTNGRLKLKFLADINGDCQLLSDKRKADPSYDQWLREKLSLIYTRGNINEVWTHFKKIFTATYDLVSYRPIFEEYVYQFLQEHLSDKVFYVEIRGPFVELYELTGKKYDAFEFIDVLKSTVDTFKKDHPDFVGAKYIYSTYRKIEPEALRLDLIRLKQINKRYPNFIIGVDFVGFEEDAALSNYVEELKGAGIQYFFHAGETNWYGGNVDHNLVDAILLGSKRIGHAFALPKHPELVRMIRKHDIAIEICPISNQVLGLIDDFRNHPGSYFVAQGLPVVICNDDPGNWGAEGLSYDWYLAFMAMTSEGAGLEVLKKLAVNSINYSGMGEEEKGNARVRWEVEWDVFVKGVVL